MTVLNYAEIRPTGNRGIFHLQDLMDLGEFNPATKTLLTLHFLPSVLQQLHMLDPPTLKTAQAHPASA